MKILVKTLLLSIMVINICIAQSSWYSDYVPTIPSDRRVDWHNVGDKEKPTSYNAIFNVINYGAVSNDGNDRP